jgi:hypothetical protein
MAARIETSLTVHDEYEENSVSISYDASDISEPTVTLLVDDTSTHLTLEGALMVAEAITRVVNECKSRVNTPVTVNPRD